MQFPFKIKGANFNRNRTSRARLRLVSLRSPCSATLPPRRKRHTPARSGFANIKARTLFRKQKIPPEKRKVFYEEETCFYPADGGRHRAFCRGKGFPVFADSGKPTVQHNDARSL